MQRPNWHEYFLGLAFVISARSRDAETKHGSVITDDKNIIIGTGYNSFIKGIDDRLFPNKRPAKYDYIIHSEENSLLNCKIPPREVGGTGASIYVTGTPCNSCLQRLIQAGVKNFYIAKRQGTKLESENSKKIQQLILKEAKINWVDMDVDLSWISDIVGRSIIQEPPQRPLHTLANKIYVVWDKVMGINHTY
jgi:dCMP deaminase